MRSVALSTLRSKVRQRADMEQSQFCSDSEINAYISDSATELYDLLIAAGALYAVSSEDLSVVSGTDTYALPADFYKILGCDLVLDGAGNAASLKPFAFGQRNQFTHGCDASGVNSLRYLLQADSIKFVPAPRQGQTIKLWYAQALPPLAADSDTLDGVNGWEEYVVVDAAIKCLQKEESDVSVLFAQKQKLERRIQEMSVMRNIGDSDRVQDVTRSGALDFWAFGE